jgi:tryptophanyl-tRNA synthetase
MATILTGIKATGDMHLGRYLGAVRPAIQRSMQKENTCYYFIADYHSLTTLHDGKVLKKNTYEIAASWLACGLDPKSVIIYRQSDVPEILELSWILSCFTPKGLMNRAHAYKAIVAQNEEKGNKDSDDGVNMGLYMYPILMSADILAFSANKIPVGEDQLQHIEICRDIAKKFNQNYGDVLTIPEPEIQSHVKTVPGLDGRKMSASYNNTIPIFATEKKLRQLVMKIKTDSSSPEDPKNPEDSLIMDLFKEFASVKEIESLTTRYKKGIGWGEAKQELFEVLNRHFSPMREKYDFLMDNQDELDRILLTGANKAREEVRTLLKKVREKIGVMAK